MRIGIDARELCGRPTGVGRYLSGLVNEWARAGHDARHEFVLYAGEPVPMPLDGRRFASRLVAGRAGTFWEQLALPRAIKGDHLDVWFSPAYAAPLALTLPMVVAIHDVSFAAHPEWFRIREGLRRRWLARQSAERARAVITISEFSRRELIEHLSVPSDKIHVIPPGLTASPDSSLSQSPIPGRYRVLYVGSIFNRRHVVDLIRAFAPIARERSDVSLDIVGDNRSYPRQNLTRTIASEGLQLHVRWHEYASDEELRDLYGQARAFAFLSEYEGLGLTPLEALGAGVPPVLLDTAVARESCGAAALYVPANDLPAVTRALRSLLFDEAARAPLLAEAPIILAKYAWPRAARETLGVLINAGATP